MKTWLPEERFRIVAYDLEPLRCVRFVHVFIRLRHSWRSYRCSVGVRPSIGCHSSLRTVARAEGEAFQRNAQWLCSGICTGSATLQAPRSCLRDSYRKLVYPVSYALLLCSVASAYHCSWLNWLLMFWFLVEGEEVGRCGLSI